MNKTHVLNQINSNQSYANKKINKELSKKEKRWALIASEAHQGAQQQGIKEWAENPGSPCGQGDSVFPSI